ncbi:hypothetical protein BDK51DRAFT_34082 [Blyttiomyces helicus]|uniref:DHHA1 domain-containing protein n=1 Tax=Blyttiomyces helicus TaxID=388810 RepID=A0A4P9W098_9FUNG|nr:hypothetical protein BDK51DRAFT_34082 [Blyttiomyces helicus]|eukprot:RKO84513.1 hypothetical protein BDK51DRAFT_34082 [Blyttiomyces helicus]
MDESALPDLRKRQLRREFAALKKDFDDQDKARKANESKMAVERIKDYFAQNPDAAFLVEVLPVGGNTKALAKAIETVKGLKDKAALLIAVDAEAKKVTHQCIVPKHLVEKGFKATDWAGIVSDKVGGKKGGKDDSAAGAGTEVAAVDDAIKLASEFARKLIL